MARPTLTITSFSAQKLEAEPPLEAIRYAQKHFAKFVDKFEKEIQLLMGSLMYIPVGLENSPYRSLSGANLLMEVSVAMRIAHR